MKNILDIENFLNKKSINVFKTKTLVNEWKIIIIFFLVAKLVTALVSGLSAFNYTNDMLLKIVNQNAISFILSIVLLIFIEYLTNSFISKFWEYTFKVKILTSIILAFVSIGLFSISFQMSCNGIEMYYKSKADDSVIIKDSLNINTVLLKTEYENRINRLNSQIETVKSNPQGWTHGKRTILLQEQLEQIENYNNQIAKLQTELKDEQANLQTQNETFLNTYTEGINHTGKNYYWAVAIIMFIQMGLNGALMFFYKRNYYNIKKQDAFKQEVENLREEIQTTIFKEVFGSVKNGLNFMLSIFKNNNLLNENIDINAPGAMPGAITNKTSGIGFLKNLLKQDDEITKKNETRDDSTTVVETTQNQKKDESNTPLRICEHCGKEYVYKIINQRFCCTTCRKSNWKLVNKRDLPEHIN